MNNLLIAIKENEKKLNENGSFEYYEDVEKIKEIKLAKPV